MAAEYGAVNPYEIPHLPVESLDFLRIVSDYAFLLIETDLKQTLIGPEQKPVPIRE